MFEGGNSMKGYLFLLLGIVMEGVGGYCLKISSGFSLLLPSVVCLLAYICCNFFIAKALGTTKMSIAYATWYGAGVGIAAVYSLYIFKESLSKNALIGIAVILIGIVITNLGDGKN